MYAPTSRRTPATDRSAALNQAIIKQLLKIDTNKTCADCKRNKHPRWASWNLGVFVCIRCSGIHRGMGTHISRVKSVDLDTWTDQQIESVVKWGNARCNKYYEAKLAPGHVPSEAKIENFIRTKYEKCRWAMDGPKPDPSTLDDQPQQPEATSVNPQPPSHQQPEPTPTRQSIPAPPQPGRKGSLLTDDDDSAPATTQIPPPVSASNSGSGSAAAPAASQKKPGKPSDVFGLDFFDSASPAASASSTNPASNTTASSRGPSRADLKQSILSLYSKPASPTVQPQAQFPQQDQNYQYSHPHSAFDAYSSVSPPPSHSQAPSQAPPQKPDAFGGLVDAFSGLTLPSKTTPQPVKQTTSPSGPFSPPGGFNSPSIGQNATGGSKHSSASAMSPMNLLGSNSGNAWTAASQKASSGQESKSNSLLEDMTSLGNGGAGDTTQDSRSNSAGSRSSQVPNILGSIDNAWANPAPAPAPAPTTTTSALDPLPGPSGFSTNVAPSGGNRNKVASMMQVPDTITPNDLGHAWDQPAASSANSSRAKQAYVTADEDFVDNTWTTSATSAGTAAAGAARPAPSSTTNAASGVGLDAWPPTTGSDDLFSNVWDS